MSGALARMAWQEAAAVARAVVGDLRAVCDHLIVAGSLRRRWPDVGDIEIVCVPTLQTATGGLFGDAVLAVDLLDGRVRELLADGTLRPRLDKHGRQALGRRYRRLLYRGTPLDLFSPDAASFGAHVAIRTGPPDYSHRLVTPRSQRGLMPDHLRMWEGSLRRRATGEALATPTEASFFEALGVPWIRPEDRR